MVGMASCQNMNSDSIDEYEITKVDVIENQAFDNSSPVFTARTCKNFVELEYGCKSYVGTPILFSANNYFSYAQTKTFAKKYSYALSDLEEVADSTLYGYRTYNKKIENGLISIPASVGDLEGAYAYVLEADLTKYSVKSKKDKNKQFSIFVADGPILFKFIKIY